MYHLTQGKGGISSIELGRRLGVTQTTAWKIKHKLMQAMMERDATKRLTGRIEIERRLSRRGAQRRQAGPRFAWQDAVADPSEAAQAVTDNGVQISEFPAG